MGAVREVLSLDVLDEEFAGDSGYIDDSVAMAVRRERWEAERLLLAELPEGFVIERVRMSGEGWPRGFELSLFDERRRPRWWVATVARRHVGRPVMSWSSAPRLCDPECGLALSAALRLAAS